MFVEGSPTEYFLKYIRELRRRYPKYDVDWDSLERNVGRVVDAAKRCDFREVIDGCLAIDLYIRRVSRDFAIDEFEEMLKRFGLFRKEIVDNIAKFCGCRIK